MRRFAMACVLVGAASPALAASGEKVEGYAEFRDRDVLVVDGQRIRQAPSAKVKGVKSLSAIPLGFEVTARGSRAADGSVAATEIEAKPNGSGMFEGEIRQSTDQAEAEYRQAGRFYQKTDKGEQTIGKVEESGPRVARVRRIVLSLIPPYIDRGSIRAYVIDNKEWNAFAMANGAVWVFSGLLQDMDDDEVAIILGHELTHASYEHTRRQFKKQMFTQLAALGIVAGAQQVDDKRKGAVLQMAAGLGAAAYSSGYGRDLEDQADRVGLRYAYEAGYDVNKGPRLWNRFAQKYGDSNKVANFFFGDHSVASARQKNLEREIANNYRTGPKPRGR